MSDLDAGRALYVSKCSGCHALFSPDRFDANTWMAAVKDMAPRAGATPAEEDLIVRYIFSQRRDYAEGMRHTPGTQRPGVPRSEP
jgi:mono/diheme cytochrome c family protein